MVSFFLNYLQLGVHPHRSLWCLREVGLLIHLYLFSLVDMVDWTLLRTACIYSVVFLSEIVRGIAIFISSLCWFRLWCREKHIIIWRDLLLVSGPRFMFDILRGILALRLLSEWTLRAWILWIIINLNSLLPTNNLFLLSPRTKLRIEFDIWLPNHLWRSLLLLGNWTYVQFNNWHIWFCLLWESLQFSFGKLAVSVNWVIVTLWIWFVALYSLLETLIGVYLSYLFLVKSWDSALWSGLLLILLIVVKKRC